MTQKIMQIKNLSGIYLASYQTAFLLIGIIVGCFVPKNKKVLYVISCFIAFMLLIIPLEIAVLKKPKVKIQTKEKIT